MKAMDYIKQADEIAQYFRKLADDTSDRAEYDAVADRLPLTIAMAFVAGAVALPIYQSARRGEATMGLTDKSDRANGQSSPVTIADEQVSERTYEMYAAKFPDDLFEGEEGKHFAKNAKVTLVQDEIDGTQNYVLGYGSFSYVNALYLHDDTTEQDCHVTSLVYDPLHRVLFVAVLGLGGFRFDLSESYEIVHMRPVQVSNPDVRTAKTPPYILMDTMGLGEDPILRRVLQKLGYKVEPLSGSGLKVAVVSSEAVACAVFRSQRGNPDPWDIAAASLLVTEGRASDPDWEQNRGKATSLSGGPLLTSDRKFYDGYAIGAPHAHSQIVMANTMIEKALSEQGITQDDMTPKQWDELAEHIAATMPTQL